MEVRRRATHSSPRPAANPQPSLCCCGAAASLRSLISSPSSAPATRSTSPQGTCAGTYIAAAANETSGGLPVFRSVDFSLSFREPEEEELKAWRAGGALPGEESSVWGDEDSGVARADREAFEGGYWALRHDWWGEHGEGVEMARGTWLPPFAGGGDRRGGRPARWRGTGLQYAPPDFPRDDDPGRLTLSLSAVRALEAALGMGAFTLDCFADARTARLPRFFSAAPDPEALRPWDFFEVPGAGGGVSFADEVLYAFPPPGALRAALWKMFLVRGRGALVAREGEALPALAEGDWWWALGGEALRDPARWVLLTERPYGLGGEDDAGLEPPAPLWLPKGDFTWSRGAPGEAERWVALPFDFRFAGAWGANVTKAEEETPEAAVQKAADAAAG